jgi:tetratricopeptide (TPR) repeat protein
VEARIIRTCKWLAGAGLAALALGSTEASARISIADPAKTYVQARAAAMSGDHSRAAQLLASLTESEPGQPDIAKKALLEAIGAGQMDLALNLAHGVPSAKLPTDARVLLVAEEIRRGHADRAISWLSVKGDNGDLSFLTPIVRAWAAADAGNFDQALSALDLVQQGNLAPIALESRAFILLKAKRTADAEPIARRLVGAAGGREQRLRLALADGFLAAGDRPRALMIVEGMGDGEAAARQRIMAGKSSGQAIDNSAKAFSEDLTALAADLMRVQRSAAPVGLVQVARYLNPQSSSTTALLALILARQDRSEEALALLRAVPANDALISGIRDVQVQILLDGKRSSEAYQIASAAAAAPNADLSDYSRLGKVLESMKRPAEAAEAFGRAITFAQTHDLKGELSDQLFYRANALEDAGHWPEAKRALQQALTIAPDEPLLLNFLGYAQLERGENVDAAEAMIRKATELAPDNGSITDSLGWAEFKRGKVSEAITTLQEAAEKEPDQAEIQEHLGDALYKSGRHYEARFAWNAALVTAEDEIAARVKAKLTSGLTTANAAP